MAKQVPPSQVEDMAEILQALGQPAIGRFFGGWDIRVDGRQVVMAIGDIIYLKVGPVLAEELAAQGGAPFSYAKGEGRVTVKAYYSLPSGVLDGPDILIDWVRRALRKS